LKSEGRTIFLCTHNLDEADRLADRIGIMKQKLIQVDTAKNLRSKLYGRRVSIRMRSVSNVHIDILKTLAFVKEVERAENRLSLALDDPDGMTPAIVRALVQADGEIQSVGEEKHSLEEVYLSLIGNGGGQK
jgi:ABC-2 type transport system ATP-binding protein